MTKPIQVKNIILGEGMPKICVPLTESKSEEICTQAVKCKDGRSRAGGVESRFLLQSL